MSDIDCMNIGDVDSEVIRELRSFVSEKRRRKADRLRKEHDRICCILAEAMVRSYYIDCLHVRNEEISFDRNKWGCPFITLKEAPKFSVSHAGNWVVCAYDDKNIGVDVEVIKSAPVEGIKNQFHPYEQERVLNPRNDELFTRLWTLKESYTKYRGMGLFLPMNDFYVCEDRDSTGLWKIPQDDRVSLRQWNLEKNTIMSVCFESERNLRLRMLKQEELLAALLGWRSEAC